MEKIYFNTLSYSAVGTQKMFTLSTILWRKYGTWLEGQALGPVKEIWNTWKPTGKYLLRAGEHQRIINYPLHCCFSLTSISDLMGEAVGQAGYNVLSEPRRENKRESRIWAVFNTSSNSVVISNSKVPKRTGLKIEEQLSWRRWQQPE